MPDKTTHRFYLVDVFAQGAYAGNPLAVVVGADDLPDATLQKIAAEMNFSETTFVTPVPEHDGGFRVRIFTPAREIAFAGHPILGTAWVLRNYVLPGSAAAIQLNLAEARVPVTFQPLTDGSDVAWFTAPRMSLGATSNREPVAAALGLSPDDILPTAPVQVVSAGTSAMIVPLQSLDALHRSRLDLEAFATLAGRGFPPLLYLFCRQTRQPQNDLCARFFFEAHGVREDPATGNGAAFLGAYLLEHRLLPGAELSLRIEQGYEVRRPSLVMLHAHMAGATAEVRVGGQVVPVARGELL